jgi:dihydrofolate reductase
MEEGTTFYFVTGGIEEALDRAKKAPRTKDVKIGGGYRRCDSICRLD